MIKAKRLLAVVLCALMLLSSLATVALAEGEKYFATDYVCAPKEASKTPAIKNTAVLYSRDSYDVIDGGKFYAEWDGEVYVFIKGENVFPTYDQAYNKADELASGGVPQVLIAPGTYETLEFSNAVQVYGYDWNENPNVKDAGDPLAAWTYNPAFTDGKNTEVLDVVITGAATGSSISLYGFEITHRFYDIFRAASNNKTVITLTNSVLNQKAEYKEREVLDNYAVTGRNADRANQFAFSFWNGNSHGTSTATANVNNKDETYLVNFRIQKVDMKQPASVSYTNYFMDELASPVFVMDGFSADWQNSGLKSMGWFKVADKVKKSYLAIKNSYIGMDLSIETRTGGSSPDTDSSISTTVEFSGNIIKNNVTVYQARTSKVDFNNNIFVNRDPLFKLGNDSAGADLSNKISLRYNTLLGYSKGFTYSEGGEQSKVDMTGTFITTSTQGNYQSLMSDAAISGNITYDYYYLDGARTIKSSAIQPFTFADADVNNDNRTINLTVASKNYNYTPSVSGEYFSYDIYTSDAEFSNLNNPAEAQKVEGALALKNSKNYFVFVAYSPDKLTGVPYKLTVTRQTATELGTLEFDGATYNGKEIYISIENNKYTFQPIVDAGVNVSVSGLSSLQNVTIGERGTTREFVFELSKDGVKDYYTVYVTHKLNDACEIVSTSGLTKTAYGYELVVEKGTASASFGINISQDATAAVFIGTKAYPLVNGIVTINDIKEAEYTIGVVAQDGVSITKVPLVIKIAKSRECEVISVSGATKTENGYVAVCKGQYTPVIMVSDEAIYSIYADENCEYALDGIFYVSESFPLWIKVTAADGVTTNVVKLDVVFEQSGIYHNGQLVTDNYLYIYAGENKSSYTLDLKAVDCTYKLYADANKTTTASNTVKLESITTYVYADVTVNGQNELVKICIESPKSAVKYTDNASIPAWAKKYVDALNEQGIGLFKGDENGNFNAQSGMTRYEVAAIAVRMMGVDASKYANVQLKFNDAIEPWAANYVKAAWSLGVLSGTYDASGVFVFDGSSTTTRAQLAKIMVDIVLYNSQSKLTAKQLYEQNKAEADSALKALRILDAAEIADWAMPYVKLSLMMGIFEGSVEGDGRYFYPNANIKRQEMAVIAYKYYIGE